MASMRSQTVLFMKSNCALKDIMLSQTTLNCKSNSALRVVMLNQTAFYEESKQSTKGCYVKWNCTLWTILYAHKSSLLHNYFIPGQVKYFTILCCNKINFIPGPVKYFSLLYCVIDSPEMDQVGILHDRHDDT